MGQSLERKAGPLKQVAEFGSGALPPPAIAIMFRSIHLPMSNSGVSGITDSTTITRASDVAAFLTFSEGRRLPRPTSREESNASRRRPPKPGLSRKSPRRRARFGCRPVLRRPPPVDRKECPGRTDARRGCWTTASRFRHRCRRLPGIGSNRTRSHGRTDRGAQVPHRLVEDRATCAVRLQVFPRVSPVT